MPETHLPAATLDTFRDSVPVLPGRRHAWRHLAVVLAAAPLLAMDAAHARSLDDQVVFLLENNCAELTNAGASPAGGSALATVCANGGGAGSSTGGGAGTVQTAPGIVTQRLLEARGEDREQKTGADEGVAEITPRLSVFVSTEYEALDRDVSDFEDGYDSDIQRLSAGGDYRLNNTTVAGAALTYYNHEGDFDSGGDFDNDSYGLTVFASFVPSDRTFVQATAGYAAKRYDRTRIAFFDMSGGATPAGPGPAKGDYDGDEYSAGILAGYDIASGNLTFGPRLGLDYIRTDFDSYRESGGTGLELAFSSADETSLQSRLGATGSMTLSTGFGVLVPQVDASWVHEFDDDQRSEDFKFIDDGNAVTFQYEDEKPDRDFFELAVGVSAVLRNGWQPYLQFRTLAGHHYLDSYVGAIGLRAEF
jgi:outer membrane autotransporter protein